MAYNFMQHSNLRKLLANIFNISTGHNHDGSNSRLITVGAPDALSVTNASVAANAAIAWSKMAALATGSILVGVANVATALDAKGDGKILIGNGTTITSQAITGDITLSNAGVVAIAGGAIVNDDVNAAAAIAWSKMAALASGHILVGSAGNVATDVAMSGVIAITNAGLTSIVAGSIVNADVNAAAAIAESKIAFSAAGHDHNGVNSALVSAGIASNLANNVTCEAGANDYTLAFGAAGGAYILTIPAVGGHRTFAFINQAQTFSANQTIQYGNLLLGDNDNGQTLQILVNENMTGNRTLTIQPNDANRIIHLHGDISLDGSLTTLGAWSQVGAFTIELTTTGATAITLPTTGTLATLAGAETLAGKTLTAPKFANGGFLADANGNEQLVMATTAAAVDYWKITNAATANPATQTLEAEGDDANIHALIKAKGTGKVKAQHGGGAALEVVTLGDTQTLTGKSYDCNGAGNALTNLNAEELQGITWPAANGTFAFGVPFVLVANVSNKNGWTDAPVLPKKARVIRAWSVNVTANGGQWRLGKGAGGVTGNICALQTVAASDTDVDYVTDLDDSMVAIAAGGVISVWSDAILDAEIYIEFMPEA